MSSLYTHVEFIDGTLSRAEFCRMTQINGEQLTRYLDAGVITGEPGFDTLMARRLSKARRLERDLGLNLAGVALALELLDEIEQLRCQLRQALDQSD